MYGVKHKIRLIFVIDKVKDDGTPLTVRQDYNLSLHDQSTLGKHLVSWRGQPFTPEEKNGFDIEKLVGVPCYVNIIHRQSGENTYANVDGIMSLPKGMQAPGVPQGFIRELDKQPSIDVGSPYYQPKEWQLSPAAVAPAPTVQNGFNQQPAPQQTPPPQPAQQSSNNGHHTGNLYGNGFPAPALPAQPQQPQAAPVNSLEPDDELPF